MIRRIQVTNYRSLYNIDLVLSDFHVLVGPNASGKTTFMDVISFVAEIVKDGVDQAIRARSTNYIDLTFCSRGGDITFAIEAELPPGVRPQNESFDMIRYELRIGLSAETGEHAIFSERALIYDSLKNTAKPVAQQTLFPVWHEMIEQIENMKFKAKSFKLILTKKPEGNDNFYPEASERKGAGGFMPSFKLGTKRTALGNLPADETKFKASMWFRSILFEGVKLFILDSQKIKQASPPGKGRHFQTDGSNLPWVIEELRKEPIRFQQWVEHIQTALPDIEDIETIERQDDRHRYLRIRYANGTAIPSWLVSDGTLRMLALTIPAYLPGFSGVYLIEEPENGIHPRAIETVIQSLSSVYGAQILIATHSPLVISLVEPSDVLCFAKTAEGMTDIVNGAEHPKLGSWHGETDFSDLFASGILG